MKSRASRALRMAAALTLLAGGGCGDDSSPTLSPATTATVPPAAGVQAPPSAGATGAGAGGTSAAGSGGAIADAGAMDSSTASPSDAGPRDAGVDAAACRVPDNIAITPDDADGGVDPKCVDVPRTIIAENCIGGFCHHSRPRPAGNLNLMSPCVADRLLDARSSCQNLLLVDSAHVEQSFILDKLESATPTCGASMPDGWHLPPEQVACMNAWVHAIIRASSR